MYLTDSTENRKTICHIYNEVSIELFGYGTVLLKANIREDVLTIRSKHRRAQRSEVLEREIPLLKEEVDFHLSKLFKSMLRQKLEQEMGLNIIAVLRDYDSSTQWAFTNIILAP